MLYFNCCCGKQAQSPAIGANNENKTVVATNVKSVVNKDVSPFFSTSVFYTSYDIDYPPAILRQPGPAGAVPVISAPMNVLLPVAVAERLAHGPGYQPPGEMTAIKIHLPVDRTLRKTRPLRPALGRASSFRMAPVVEAAICDASLPAAGRAAGIRVDPGNRPQKIKRSVSFNLPAETNPSPDLPVKSGTGWLYHPGMPLGEEKDLLMPFTQAIDDPA